MRDFNLPGRSPVLGRQAMCATSHPQASIAALDVLCRGGNAVDAAIAASAVLVVVEPAMTGIGGDCFVLLHEPGGDGPIALNGAGRAPGAADLATLRANGVTTIEMGSPHAVTVPGAIDAWDRLAADHGTRPLGELLQPAIRHAEDGFPVAARVGADWDGLAEKLKFNAGARKHLLFDGAAPSVGQVIRFPALAATLRTIADKGRDGFYTGDVADDMVGTLRAMGGLHTLEDFANQASSYVTPVSSMYRGLRLYQLPPSNSGIVANLILAILERIGDSVAPAISARRYHLALEAARLAYAMRDRFIADPDMADVPVDYIFSDAFADELAGRIDADKRTDNLGPIPEPEGSDTVYLCVVDKDGMAVSFINSVYSAFGSGIVTEKTGVVLHNRGQGFVLEEGHRNCIGPGKRPMHTLVPAMAYRGGTPELVFGVMGAMFQPMGQVYVLGNVVDYAMDVQEALDFPRVFFEGGHLEAEPSVPDAVIAEMQAMGHDVRRREEPWGGGQVIRIDPETGVLSGGSDPRKDGCALGY